MPYKDPEKAKLNRRAYYLKNKEKLSKKYKLKYIENREKIKERSRKRYYEKQDEILQKGREYYRSNKTIIDKRNQAWISDHPEVKKRINKKYKQTNKIKIKEYNKEYNRKNKKERQKYRNEWRRKNPDKVKEEKLKARFGISLLDYRELINRQDNKCGICFTEFSKIEPCIDHDHETNLIRGILCRKCNSGIGSFFDNASNLKIALEWLSRDITYLERNTIDYRDITNTFPKRYDLKRKFGITQTVFYKILIFQELKCGICNHKLIRERPFNPNIDHDHETGKIRGILCGKCNRGLGLLGDDPIIITNAIKWIEKGTL